MNISYESKTIGEVCEVGDGSHSKVARVDKGIPYLTSKNIKQGFIDLSKVDFISEENFTKLFTVRPGTVRRPETGDLLLGIIGTFGNFYSYKSTDNFGISSSIAVIRPKQELIDPKYLAAYCSSKTFKNYHQQVKSGSVQGYTNIATIKSLPIILPSIVDQKAIAHIVGTLDKKIGLNKKTNETIEGITKAIFKSWFIAFDPVRAKAEGRSTGLPQEINDLFPDSFEDSDLGVIPTDWDIKKIADWGQTVCGKTPSTKNTSYYGNDYMFVTIPDLHKGLHVTSSSKGLSKLGAELHSKKLLSKGSVLVSCIATPGLIGVLEESCFTNQQINSITPNNKNYTWFIAFYLLMNNDLLLSFGGGGSVFFNLNKSKFDSIEILSPPEKIIDKFNNFAAPLMDKCFALKKEISLLSNIKDTLLPKLISGELRIQDAEKMIEEVGI